MRFIDLNVKLFEFNFGLRIMAEHYILENNEMVAGLLVKELCHGVKALLPLLFA